MNVIEDLLRAYRGLNDPLFHASLARMKRIIDVLEAHRRFHSKAGCPGQEDCYVCAEEQWAELHNGLPDGETLDRTRPFESRKLTPTEHTEARIANVANDNSQYEDCEADE